MARVVTFVTGRVPPAQRAKVIREYEEAVRDGPPASIELTLLLEDDAELAVLSIWRSPDALEQMRASGEEPFARRLLREAGATPSVRVLGVVAEGRHARGDGPIHSEG
jgi:hypothetical protein